jgi:hypothetical protein
MIRDEGRSGAGCCDGKTVSQWTTNTWSEGLNKQLNDIRQGCVKDCHVLAAIGSIVVVSPTRLLGTIAAGYNFLPDGKTSSGDVKNIGIDKKLAVGSAGVTDFVYARWSGDVNRKYLWPMFWEKAYAKFSDQNNQFPSSIDSTQPDIGRILDGGNVKKAIKEIGRYKTFVEFQFSFDANGNPNNPSVVDTSSSPPSNLTADHTYFVIKKYANGNYQLRDPCGGIYKDLASTDLTTVKCKTWGYAKDPV